MSRPTAALRLRGIVKRFRRGLLGRAEAAPAVDAVDLAVPRGKVVALIGESGSGKTTLAHVATRLIEPDEGSTEVLGRDLATLSRSELRRFRRRFQILFQNPDAHLNPGLRVHQILRESAQLHRPDDDPAAVVADVLEEVGLSHRAHALPHELSGGEKRRVGIARVLIADPDLWVADEPTSGLDAGLKGDIIDLLLARRDGERAYLLISHDLPLVSYASDQVAVMLAGRVIEEFPIAALNDGPHHPYTAALLAAVGLSTAAPRLDEPAAGRGTAGCPYRGPCPFAVGACDVVRPLPVEIDRDHRIACHAPVERLDPVHTAARSRRRE